MISIKNEINLHSPRLALGENSDCMTGPVEFVIPSPKPATTLATIIWDLVYAVACKSDPMIITVAPIAILIRLPSLSATKAEASAPKNAPTTVHQDIVKT